MPRSSPYAAFNFLVSLGPRAVLGGFSDVSGLTTEIEIAGYREGGQKQKPVRKIPGLHKAANITLKRGVIDSRHLRLANGGEITGRSSPAHAHDHPQE